MIQAGNPADVIERVFDPFFVVNEEERGMGLGLCVSHDIIKRHGGSLTVKNQTGRGHCLSNCSSNRAQM